MTPREAMARGLDIYTAEMRDYIRTILQCEYGDEWFRNHVWPLYPPPLQKHLLRALERGEQPEDLLGMRDFQRVIEAHGDLFPTTIQEARYFDLLSKIVMVRNTFAHHLVRDFDHADVEQLLGWCSDVLEQCERITAASMIRDREFKESSPARSTKMFARLKAVVSRNLPRGRRSSATAEEELGRLLDRHRDDLRNSIQESLPGLIRDSILEDRRMRLTPDDGIANGLRIFRTDMRVYIRTVLQREYGADWCETQVAPLFPGKTGDKILKALARGASPERQLDVGLFRQVIVAHGDLFPKAIREGEHHNRLGEIANFRNRTIAHDNEDVYRADTERLLGWCIDVLQQCGRLSAASAIQDVASNIGWRQRGDGTDVE